MTKFEKFKVQELTEAEMNSVNGGWWQFVAGALIGGAIYDAYKFACNLAFEGYADGTITNVGSKR